MAVATCSRAAPNRPTHSHNATVRPVGAAVKMTAKRIVNPLLVPEGGGTDNNADMAAACYIVQYTAPAVLGEE